VRRLSGITLSMMKTYESIDFLTVKLKLSAQFTMMGKRAVCSKPYYQMISLAYLKKNLVND
jgi:hypothetical protein